MLNSISSHNNLPVLNVQAALERMGGDLSILVELSKAFIEDAPDLLSNLKSGLETRDGEAIHRSAHSLKGLAANFDGLATCEISARMETCGKEEHYDCARDLFPELVSQVDCLTSALKSQVLSKS